MVRTYVQRITYVICIQIHFSSCPALAMPYALPKFAEKRRRDVCCAWPCLVLFVRCFVCFVKYQVHTKWSI